MFAQTAEATSWWEWIERVGGAASIVGLLGILPICIYLWRRVREFTARRRIEAKPLPLDSGFTGLLCCVSAPPKGAESEADEMDRLVEAVPTLTDDALSQKLRATRIGPILKAFEVHRLKLGSTSGEQLRGKLQLQHCWLIASHDSRPYFAPLMKACKKYFPNVTVHPPIEVPDVYEKIDDVYNATHRIFNECEKATRGVVTPKLLIADLTGGTKIMSVAVAMACLDIDRQMEYIEQRDQKTFFVIDITYDKVSKRPAPAASEL